MANNPLSLDVLKSHLFEALEGVKNLSDPDASENEKMSIEQSKQIVDIAGAVIDICKLQVDAIKTFNQMDNVGSIKNLVIGIGIANENNTKTLEE